MTRYKLYIALFFLAFSSSFFAQEACSDENACNYTPAATQCIRIETVATHSGIVGNNDLTGMTTYRVYAVLDNPDDVVSALIGDEEHPGYFNTSSTFFQHSLGGATPNGINAAFYTPYPSLQYDSWVTIGIENSPEDTEGAVNLIEDDLEPWVDNFEAGGNIEMTSAVGGGWYSFSNFSNVVAGDDLEVLIGQFTTSGTLSGQIYIQVFTHGDSEQEIRTLANLNDPCGVGSVDDCVYAEEFYDCDGNCLVDLNDNGVCDQLEISGCTSSFACNYNENATQDDGSCDFVSCITFGCTDVNACNYDSEADYDDGECVYSNYPYDCDGQCLADDDGDGICDQFEIFGCTDETACNYSAGATNDDGLCEYDCYGCTDPAACNFNSEAIFDDESCEFTSCYNFGCMNDEACNYDPTAEVDDLSCEFESCVGCTSEFACNYDPTATIDNNSCDFVSCLTFGCVDPTACNFDPEANFDNGSCFYANFPYDCEGNCVNDVDEDGICDEFEVAGCTDVTACNYASGATLEDGSCEYSTCAGCTSSVACNYDPSATIDDGSCDFTSCLSFGCTDPVACNYNNEADLDDGNCEYANFPFNCEGGCVNDIDLDGICDEYEIPGCTNENACNFNPSATDENGSCDYSSCLGCTIPYACNYDINASVDDGSCDFLSCISFGCTDPVACNYDSEADYDNGACVYANFPYDCSNNCINDDDGDGICDEFEIFGCTDADACNYSAGATNNDGSCDFDSCLGCTDAGACNFDSDATIDDGSCDFDCFSLGCTDEIACNYDSEAAYNDGSCIYIAEGECDCDGNLDSDGDGVCDYEDECIGQYDECGVCNGEGAIYECGCSDIPEGDCDCDGNQLDVLGVCGGDCTADADGDGVCDDEDECVGQLDACGVCNGEGAIYECGCADIPEGDCDCNGNQLDILGVCGGDCSADADGDGVCDDVDDCVGEYDECGICNGSGANSECGCADIPEGDCDCDGNQLDAIGVCGGDCSADADGDGVCDDEDECVGQYDECGVCNGEGAIYECGCSDIPTGDCDCEGNQLDVLGECGGDCTADADSDGVCDDVDECVGQYDECGVCNGEGAIYECGCTDIPEGDCDCNGNQLDVLGVCGGNCTADADGDGVCDDEDDCVGQYDECGVCNGVGAVYECGCADIPAGDCDCDGNELDALGECGGDCTADADDDGVCDDEDECVGQYDECGVCNGEGAIYECGCADIPEGDCDCDGNQLDALGECGGDCTADADGDGVCDDVDECVGQYDECGVCNGEGAIYECGCSDIPTGDCDCEGNQLDVLGECGGDCTADADSDGVCDDVDECVGQYDECGVCNGEGAIYECGCTDIPEVDCDCNGNQLDVLGVCGGNCTADADGDGVCDDEDDCVGQYDECGVCNGEGAVYECGCADIPEGDCDCDGNQLDDLGECGGDCTSDADGDGVCDDEDECVGQYDECGVCNGPGEIYDCGCFDIPEGECDCIGSVEDIVGNCGGDCTEDVNQNGICDTEEQGCTDPENPGYDPYAAFDDGSCLEGGCTIAIACNYNPDAQYMITGSCDFTSCAGCMDPEACNYDADATIDSGHCEEPEYAYDCDGECLNDTDGDGICDEFEVYGCTDPENPGFDPEATEDDGSCHVGGCTIPIACNYDSDADFLVITDCEFNSCIGCMDPEACNFDPEATLANIYMCEYPPNDMFDCEGLCANDVDEDGVCDEEDPCVGQLDACGVCNGPGAIYECGCSDVPQGDCDCNGNELDAVGVCGGDCTADIDNDGICDDVDDCVGQYDTCGVCNGGGIPEGNCDCDGNVDDAIGICGGSCEADENENGICDTDEMGCTDPDNPNFDPSAAFDDGSCATGGCVVFFACNYDPEADYQIWGSCEFSSCAGCTDEDACNYDPEATLWQNWICEYPSYAYDCNDECENDSDGDGICDEFEIQGCTDPQSPNYDPGATDDDGSCLEGGCIFPFACNYDPNADFMMILTCDFTSCIGCTDPEACTYDEEATINDQSECEYAENDHMDCSGDCINDTDGDGVCDEDEVAGCTDPSAPNYNSEATDDDGSCLDALVGGCIIPFACNYDPNADFYIPGSCIWGPCGDAPMSDYCYDLNACNYGYMGQCEFESCLALGCTDVDACNYDDSAVYNDGNCVYIEECNTVGFYEMIMDNEVINDSRSSAQEVVDEELNEEMFSVYSPSLSTTIVVTGYEDCDVELYDLSGKLVRKLFVLEGTSETLVAPTYGVYLVKAQKIGGTTFELEKVYVN